MHKLYYQPKDSCFGDCMPFGIDKTYYLFHQRDKRNPGPLPDCEPFGWDLVTTEDFVHYEDRGTAISCGKANAQDQFIFAGSVFQGNGLYHAFYTGFNRDYPALGKPSQVLMHAYSHDLIHWEKREQFLSISPQEGYDVTDWRDPFVLWDDEKNNYLLILGARKDGDKHLQTGCTVYFTSIDLEHWEFQGDFWAPELFTMHEMPDLFKIGDWWYLLTTEYSHRCKTVYRMSKSLNGPWIKPEDDAFDGRGYYAARSFSLNGHRMLFGWVPTRAAEDDTSDFVWGGTYMAHELYQKTDGSLGVKIPDTVWNAFQDWTDIPSTTLNGSMKQVQEIMLENTGDLFAFEADFTFTTGSEQFGIFLKSNPVTGRCYQFSFSVPEKRFYFDKIPNWPWPAIQNNGLERPLDLTSNTKYKLRLIVDDSIATLYVNGTALNVRMYSQIGTALGFKITNGSLIIENAKFSNFLAK